MAQQIAPLDYTFAYEADHIVRIDPVVYGPQDPADRLSRDSFE
jgi:hypothetical protein